jgi:hypothetical protein
MRIEFYLSHYNHINQPAPQNDFVICEKRVRRILSEMAGGWTCFPNLIGGWRDESGKSMVEVTDLYVCYISEDQDEAMPVEQNLICLAYFVKNQLDQLNVLFVIDNIPTLL